MQSPALEAGLDIAHLAVRNLLRAQGPPDFDTFSEVNRELVRRLGKFGPLIFTIGLFGGAEIYRRHILNPLKERA